MESTTQIDLWNRDSGSVTGSLIVTSWDGRDAQLSLAAPDIDLLSEARGRDLFDALQQLRLQLEPLGWIPLCNGARVDCYPSGMARDMGGGQKVYILGSEPGRPPLVETLEPAPREMVGTVADQDAHYERWLTTRRNR
jgi:hypothetical protein